MTTKKSDRPRKAAKPVGPRLVTACIEGSPAQSITANPRRLRFLVDLCQEIDRKWGKLDALVLPGGFLRLGDTVGRLTHEQRVERLKAAGFIQALEDAGKALCRSPGVLIMLGVDGPNYPNGDVRDQMCVAANGHGIVGIGRKIFPVQARGEEEADEAHTMLCYDADFGEPRRVVTLNGDRKAVLCACYDMFGVGERGDPRGARGRMIRRIGNHADQMKRGDEGFKERLGQNLAAFRDRLSGVQVGIAAIHGFGGHSTGFWQRHGIAACSAGLNRGFAVGAAHFSELPEKLDASTLAAAGVPRTHLTQGQRRKAHSWKPRDGLRTTSNNVPALVRLFHLAVSENV